MERERTLDELVGPARVTITDERGDTHGTQDQRRSFFFFFSCGLLPLLLLLRVWMVLVLMLMLLAVCWSVVSVGFPLLFVRFDSIRLIGSNRIESGVHTYMHAR